MNVEQKRAAGVAVVGHVDFAARKPPGQKRVDRAEQNLAPLCPLAQAVDRVKNVPNLGPGKIRIEHQAGLLPKSFFMAVGLELLAERSRNAALPDDRIRHRLPGIFFPDDSRLALIGDADPGNVSRRKPRLCECLFRCRQLALPDRLRIVLDMPGRRKQLRKLLLSRRYRKPLLRKNNRPAGRRSLVERENVFRHISILEHV